MIFFTTYNKKLFDAYAHQLIETYQSTQQTLPMYVFVEDNIEDFPKVPNVTYVNLFLKEPECHRFVERHKERRPNHYMKDAVKFCYKVFAQSAAREFGDKLYYVDTDCVFLKQIPNTWFNECLPDDTFLSFYDRPHREPVNYIERRSPSNYTETGFVAFNNTRKISDDFFNIYKDWYISDNIFNLKAFLDCHALDATRLKFRDNPDYTEKKLGDGELSHIIARDKFINSYIDHKKDRKYSLEWKRRN